jgi:hypothetical protein
MATLIKQRTIGWALASIITAAAPASAQQILFDEPVRAGDLMLFRDLTDEKAYYYMPTRPRLATDANGRKQFSFFRWVENAEVKKEAAAREGDGGGIIHALVTFGVPKEMLQEAERDLQRQRPGARIAGPIVPKSGTVGIISTAVAPKKNPDDPEDQPSKLAGQVLGVGNAPLLDGDKTSVSILLSKQGAKVLWEQFQMATANLDFAFEVKVQGFRKPQRVLIEADLEQIVKHDSFAAGIAGTWFAGEIKGAFDELRKRNVIKVTQIGALGVGEKDSMEERYKEAYDRIIAILFEKPGEAGAGGAAAPQAVTGTDAANKGMMERATEQLKSGRDHAEKIRKANEEIRKRNAERAVKRQAAAKAEKEASEKEAALAAAEAAAERAKQRAGSAKSAADALARKSAEAESAKTAAETDKNAATAASQRATQLAEAAKNAETRLSELRTALDKARADAQAAADDAKAAAEARVTELEGQLQQAEAAATDAKAQADQAKTAADEATTKARDADATIAAAATAKRDADDASQSAGKLRTDAEAAGGGIDQLRAAANSARQSAQTAREPADAAGPDERERDEGSDPGFAVLATYQIRRQRQTGMFRVDLNKYMPEDRTFPFRENIGDLRPLAKNPAHFRQINLDDPLYRQREIVAVVDVQNAKDFGEFVNFVAVRLRKKHESGELTHEEIRIDRKNFNEEGAHFKMLYGWKGDNNRTRWMDYEYQEVWSFSGGHQVEQPWRAWSANSITLAPPMQRRSVDLAADPKLLADNAVRAITVKVFYRPAEGAPEQVRQVTLNAAAPAVAGRIDFVSPPNALEYDYEITWRLTGNRTVSTGRQTTSEAILYVDEPTKPSSTPTVR